MAALTASLSACPGRPRGGRGRRAPGCRSRAGARGGAGGARTRRRCRCERWTLRGDVRREAERPRSRRRSSAAVRSRGRCGRCPGRLGHLHRGLVAALGHDQLGHLAGQVDVGGADVAVRVGERVGRVVDRRPSASLSAMPATSTPPPGVRPHDRASAPGRRSGSVRVDRVDVGDVVGERVQPGLVHAERGARRCSSVSKAPIRRPPTVLSRSKWSLTRRG